MEPVCLMIFQVVVVVGLFDLISPFLLYYFMSTIIQHPLLSYSLHTVTVPICLLLL